MKEVPRSSVPETLDLTFYPNLLFGDTAGDALTCHAACIQYKYDVCIHMQKYRLDSAWHAIMSYMLLISGSL
jgi:hypothetical protein